MKYKEINILFVKDKVCAYSENRKGFYSYTERKNYFSFYRGLKETYSDFKLIKSNREDLKKKMSFIIEQDTINLLQNKEKSIG